MSSTTNAAHSAISHAMGMGRWTSPLIGLADSLQGLRAGVRMRRQAAATRRVNDALEDHLRADIGLGPRSAAPPPTISPIVAAWLR
jgi:hypothetical protein